MEDVVKGRHDERYKVLPEYIKLFKERNPNYLYFINWKDEDPCKNLSFRRCQIYIGQPLVLLNSTVDHSLVLMSVT